MAELVAEGTILTHDVEVKTLTPPSPIVVVKVLRTALEVRTAPAVMVERVCSLMVGELDSSTQSRSAKVQQTKISVGN